MTRAFVNLSAISAVTTELQIEIHISVAPSSNTLSAAFDTKMFIFKSKVVKRIDDEFYYNTQ